MSTKTTTNTANQYNQGAMNNYNQFQGQIGSTLNSFLSNPLGNSYFQQQLGMAQNNASQIGQRNMSNVLNNAQAGAGMLGNSGSMQQGLINRTMMGNSAGQSGAFNSALGSALSMRGQALQGMMGYSPLMTGAKTTQQQGGLGTWLPQLAGAGLGAAMGGMGGMLGGGGGALSGASGLAGVQATAANSMGNFNNSSASQLQSNPWAGGMVY